MKDVLYGNHCFCAKFQLHGVQCPQLLRSVVYLHQSSRRYALLILCVGAVPHRFCLGIGVGGEYPLAATVTSESSSAATRGGLMAGEADACLCAGCEVN